MNSNFAIWILILAIAFMGYRIMIDSPHPAAGDTSNVSVSATVPLAPTNEAPAAEPFVPLNGNPDHKHHLTLDDASSSQNEK